MHSWANRADLIIAILVTIALLFTATNYYVGLVGLNPNSAGTTNVSTTMELNPFLSRIGSSNSSNPIGEAQQRHVFFAFDLFWVFYSNGVDMVYSSSSNGFSWSSPEAIRPAQTSADFSVWFNGSNFFYAYALMNNLSYFREGLSTGSGVITWLGAEQEINLTSSVYFPFVAADSNGYPWISYVDTFGNIWVAKSTSNNGTFVMAKGFPVELARFEVPVASRAVVYPLSNGVMVAMWTADSIPIHMSAWTGALWENQTATKNPISPANSLSIVTSGGGTIFITFSNSSQVYFAEYSYLSNSIKSEVLVSVSGNNYPQLTMYHDSFIIFWKQPGGNYVLFSELATTGWTQPSQCLAESHTIYLGQIGSSEIAINDTVGMTYETDIGLHFSLFTITTGG